MRDIVLIFPSDSSDTSWNLDIDIVDGFSRLVSYEDNTQDQRAAVAALIAKGSIPGNTDFGVDWKNMLQEGNSFLLIDNDIKRQISSLAGLTTEEAQIQYVPIYKQNDKGGIDIQVCRTQ